MFESLKYSFSGRALITKLTYLSPKTWIKKDFHVHEHHSSDAPLATVDGYCELAERRGVDEICLTTHLILSGPDMQHGISPERIPGYLEEIQRTQSETDVKIYSGLEVDWFPEVEERIGGIVDEYSLDYVLGSLHYVKGIDIGSKRHSPAFFLGKKIEEAIDVYFEEWKRAVESCLFDVMAHPDYFRKFLSLTHETPVPWESYGSMVYSAIDSLKSYNVGIEVNSSGWRHGIGNVYPILEFLKAAKEVGVDKIVVGSDCHRIKDLGVNTIKSVERLRGAGYDHLCIFENRRDRRISLSKVI